MVTRKLRALCLVLGMFHAQVTGAQERDADEDAIDDAIDNCPAVSNSSQLDADDDGRGNACDCDFNNDGACAQPDYSILLACFGKEGPSLGPPDDPTCRESDMDGDGVVGPGDQQWFSVLFGRGLQE